MTDPELDVGALYAALDQRRQSKKLSWRQAATAAGVSPSTLTRLGQGKRPDVTSFAALLKWLGIPAEHFLTGVKTSRGKEQDFLTVVSVHLRARKELSPRSAEALEDIIRAAYNNLRERDSESK
jgi:transcriptional regulator with XRE-family HTH domain